MDFVLDCPTLDQINPEPLQDMYWPFMMPITVDTTASLKTHYAPSDTPSPPTYHPQEPYTYTSLEPCTPMTDVSYAGSYTGLYTVGGDDVASDCDSDASQQQLQQQQREVCEASVLGKLCFMNDEGLGSSSSSVSSMSPIDLMQDGGGDVCGGERPSTSDSGCALDSFPQSPPPQCVQCGATTSAQWISLSAGYLCLQCVSAADSPPPAKRKKASIASEHRECSNCHTRHTSLWRRNSDGNFNCNACGLYEKMNKISRPLNMRRDVIKRRQRKTKQASKKQKIDYSNETPHRFLLSSMLPQYHDHDQRAAQVASQNSDVYSNLGLPSVDRSYYSPISSPLSTVSHSCHSEDLLSSLCERPYYAPSNDLDLPSQMLMVEPQTPVLEDTDS